MNASGNVGRLDVTGLGLASNVSKLMATPDLANLTPEKKIGAAVKANDSDREEERFSDTLKATEERELLEEAGPI